MIKVLTHSRRAVYTICRIYARARTHTYTRTHAYTHTPVLTYSLNYKFKKYGKKELKKARAQTRDRPAFKPYALSARPRSLLQTRYIGHTKNFKQ